MKFVVNLRPVFLCIALLCIAGGSSALTLGKPRSVVLLGQPLDVTIPVGLGPDDDASALCFDADVFYGDVQQEAGRVAVSLPQPTQAAVATVRVRARAGVDEAIVTIDLRAGCQHKVSRRYVLLTEVVSEVDTPVSVRSTEVRQSVALPSPLAKQRVAGVPSDKAPALPSKRGKGASKANAVSTSPPTVAHAETIGGKSVASAKVLQKARLKLTPLDLRVERDPVLKSTDVLFDLPIEDLQKRAQAVATWRALNATPQEVMQQEAQLLSLDGNIKSLGALTVKNQHALIDLTAQLERAQAERYRNPLVYGLAFVLLACVAGIAFLLVRMRRQNGDATPWWGASGVDGRPETQNPEEDDESVFRSVAPSRPSAKAPVVKGATERAAVDVAGVDIDLELRESTFRRFAQDSTQDDGVSLSAIVLPTEPVLPGHRDFSYSVNATLRAINTQDMLDERQQAEFFMTLGQHEEAIQLLEDSIRHSADANPLVYLDLLSVLHTLSRKTEFEGYREAFNAIFSGRVPSFARFSEKGYALDAYEDVCQHIAAMWPTEDALNFIEQCLVRIHDGLTQEFDMDAFRDLLTLHGVLRRLFATSDTGLAPFSTFKTQALSQKDDVPSGGGENHSSASDQPMPLAESVPAVSSVDLDLSVSNNLLEFEELTLAPHPAPASPKY